jgi:hypothetical protein
MTSFRCELFCSILHSSCLLIFLRLQSFLANLEARMRVSERSILLLVDNASPHIVDDPAKYPHVKIHYLPPNTTSHLQPMDAGIIRTFKAHYKRLYLRHVLGEFESGLESPGDINVLQAIHLIDAAWKSVTRDTIRKCWRHTGIQPPEYLLDDNQGHVEGNVLAGVCDSAEERIPNDVQQGILAAEREALDIIEEGMTVNADLQTIARHYLENEEVIPTEEDLDDARIIELVQCPEEDNQDASDAELEEDAKVSHSEAKIYLNRIIKYVNQQPVTFSKDIHRQVLRELLSHAHHSAISAMKQGTLDTFFTEM